MYCVGIWFTNQTPSLVMLGSILLRLLFLHFLMRP